jgi:tRNA(adenine34) deaminase
MVASQKISMEDQDGESQLKEDRHWMSEALTAAREAAALGEVPVGAIVVRNEQIIARSFNRREIDRDPLAHAEILAIRQAAGVVGGWRLIGCSLYVTLEPCAMCAGALVNSRIETLVFGARDPKAGFCGSLGDLVRESRLNHCLEVREGVEEEASRKLLKCFFASLRSRSAKRSGNG